MNTTERQDPKALEHFNNANRARKRDEFEAAVAEFDACLCANPTPPLEMLAWFCLGEVIFLNFDFGTRHSSSVSDKEYYWSLRASEAIRRSIEVYDQKLSRPVWATDPIAMRCHEPYQKAKALNKFFSSYGPYIKVLGEHRFRPHEVFYNVNLSPLRCLAEYEQRMKEVARREHEKRR